MKKLLKIAAAILLIAVLLIPTALADTLGAADNNTGADATVDGRQEVIYANLAADGSVKDAYTVTILSVSEAGTVTDHGAFASVKNLTDTSAITLDGDTITATAPTGDYYYQGTLANPALPWPIMIEYILDGEPTDPSDLGGASGHLMIRLTINKNTDVGDYADNYMLQATVTLDAALCANIEAPGSTTANAGGNKSISYTVLPGFSAVYDIEADVHDFSMPGIQFAALPPTLQLDTPDTGSLKDDMTALTDAIDALRDGVAELHDGTTELRDGADALADGSSSFANGLDTLADGSGGLVSGSGEISAALTAIRDGLSGASGGLDLTALAELPDALGQMAEGIDGVSSGLVQLNTAFGDAYTALDGAMSAIPDDVISQADLAALYQSAPGQSATIDKLTAYYTAAATAKGTYTAVKPGFDAVGTSLSQSTAALDQISAGLTDTADGIAAALSSGDSANALTQLTDGIAALDDNYADFHSGLVSYTAGVRALADNYGELNGGVSSLAGGIGELNDGVGELYDGVSELADETADIPNQIDEQINGFLNDYDKSDYIPSSFVSSDNTNTTSVQFVFKTDGIDKPEAVVAPEETPADKTVWDRFLDLFR